MDELEISFDDKLAELKELGYESRYTRTQGFDDDCFWICPIGKYPEDVIEIDEDQVVAVDNALADLRGLNN